MLREIMAEFRQNPRSLCVEELSQRLAVEPGALEGMLQTLVRKGRLLEVNSGQANACVQCPAKGGCVIMGQLGKGYRLANISAATAPR